MAKMKIKISDFGRITVDGFEIGRVDSRDVYLLLRNTAGETVVVGRFGKYKGRKAGEGAVKRWLPGAIAKAGDSAKLADILTGPNHPAPGQFHPVPMTKKELANLAAFRADWAAKDAAAAK